MDLDPLVDFVHVANCRNYLKNDLCHVDEIVHWHLRGVFQVFLVRNLLDGPGKRRGTKVVPTQIKNSVIICKWETKPEIEH